ncbi:unnamed protein product [Effrenium voratum]|nr:unnamed protein product [Effrenium voratum]CAJ1426404.1 unnamed protein product [Effrenium voratum]
MKLPHVKRRVGDEFALESEKWEEASDEDEDFPHRDWVASLASRTLQPPLRSGLDLRVHHWLVEKECAQKKQWQEKQKRKDRALLTQRSFLPPVQPVAKAKLQPRLKLAPFADALAHSPKPKPPAVKAAPKPKPKVEDAVPDGWGRLKDYVNGVKIGPGSLFSHPWDQPAMPGIHPIRREAGLLS